MGQKLPVTDHYFELCFLNMYWHNMYVLALFHFSGIFPLLSITLYKKTVDL